MNRKYKTRNVNQKKKKDNQHGRAWQKILIRKLSLLNNYLKIYFITLCAFTLQTCFIIYVSSAVPGAPTSLLVTNLNMDSLTLEWNPPHIRNGHITGYTLKYQPGETVFLENNSWAFIYSPSKFIFLHVVCSFVCPPFSCLVLSPCSDSRFKVVSEASYFA